MKSISGFWAGIYRYLDPNYPTVKFDCELTQENSTLFGAITEVDILKTVELFSLKSSISGYRSGRKIKFTKTYINADENYALPVYYRGTINWTGRRISGVWNVADWNGTFEMRRESGDWRASNAVFVSNDNQSEEPA